MLSLTASALQGARRTGDPSVLAAALEARLWATWRPDAVEERLATAEELLAEAEAAGLPDVGVVARRWRVTALVEAGRMDEAWVECARHAESANRLRLPYEQLYVAVFTAMRALLEGRLEDVEVASQQVASFSELRGGADALQFGGVHALTLAQIHGDLAPMADALAFFVAAYPDLPGWRGALAYVLVATGRRDEAAEQVDALWPPSETLPFDANWLPAHYFLAWAVIGLEDARRARQLYDALSPWASRPVVLGAAGAVWGTTSLVLAALADLLGDDAAADQHRREADAEARRIGAIAGFERAGGAGRAVARPRVALTHRRGPAHPGLVGRSTIRAAEFTVDERWPHAVRPTWGPCRRPPPSCSSPRRRWRCWRCPGRPSPSSWPGRCSTAAPPVCCRCSDWRPVPSSTSSQQRSACPRCWRPRPRR